MSLQGTEKKKEGKNISQKPQLINIYQFKTTVKIFSRLHRNPSFSSSILARIIRSAFA